MDKELFKRYTDEYVRKAYAGLINAMAIDNLSQSMHFGDPELGEVSEGSLPGGYQFSVPRDGKYPIPIPLPIVGRGTYQKEMALYYNQEANFKTLVPLNPNKFKLVHPNQNHFRPDFAYYLEVLHGQVAHLIGNKDPNQKLNITSGFRSLSYNDALREKSKARNGGVTGVSTWSAHSGGIACDILASSKADRITILDAAYAIGFGGLLNYNSDGFVHIDISGRHFQDYTPPDKR